MKLIQCRELKSGQRVFFVPGTFAQMSFADLGATRLCFINGPIWQVRETMDEIIYALGQANGQPPEIFKAGADVKEDGKVIV